MSVTPLTNGTWDLCICSVPFAISDAISRTFVLIRDRNVHSRVGRQAFFPLNDNQNSRRI
jgi:hypothetical protein